MTHVDAKEITVRQRVEYGVNDLGLGVQGLGWVEGLGSRAEEVQKAPCCVSASAYLVRIFCVPVAGPQSPGLNKSSSPGHC